MIQRPRAHQLESKSRSAFLDSLPDSWVFRDMIPDYGIDGLVEVFDPEGTATGQQFLVQIKATDEPDIKKCLKVRLSKRHLTYYSALVLPVLLVRYHATSLRIFAKWVSEEIDIVSSKTLSSVVQLAVDDIWSLERIPAVLLDLDNLQSAKARGNREMRIERYIMRRKQ